MGSWLLLVGRLLAVGFADSRRIVGVVRERLVERSGEKMQSPVRRGDVALVSPASTRRRFAFSWGGDGGGGGAGKSRLVLADKTGRDADTAGSGCVDCGDLSSADFATDGLIGD
jgi:hypothetical protein